MQQAAEVFRVLAEERIGDIGIGWEALAKHGDAYVTAAENGLSALKSQEPEVAAAVEAEIGSTSLQSR